MMGVLANTLAIVCGGLLGLLCKKGIPERISDAVLKVLGAYSACIGIMGVLKARNLLVLLVAAVLGTVCGELLDIDAAVEKLGARLEARAKTTAGGVSRGFVTGSLLYCVGAMSIVGAIQSGTVGDHTTLYAKSVMDFIASLMMASSLGAGIPLSAVSVLVYEGAIALLAGVLAPVLTEVMIAEITAVGSLMILLLGCNIMGITKIKVANLLPGIVFAPFLSLLFTALGVG